MIFIENGGSGRFCPCFVDDGVSALVCGAFFVEDGLGWLGDLIFVESRRSGRFGSSFLDGGVVYSGEAQFSL